mmetsp:Transcript_29156/g.77385  ORF Transcript_29156/g.77385 Transcript_29156/m.77385 type:complete len:205 (+) Transcript_29156:409-1023(+)
MARAVGGGGGRGHRTHHLCGCRRRGRRDDDGSRLHGRFRRRNRRAHQWRGRVRSAAGHVGAGGVRHGGGGEEGPTREQLAEGFIDGVHLGDDRRHRRSLGRLMRPARVYERPEALQLRCRQCNRRALALHDGERGLQRASPLERQLPVRQLPEEHAKGVHVAFAVILLVRNHLGRHPAVRARLRRQVGRDVGRQPKVCELHVLV